MIDIRIMLSMIWVVVMLIYLLGDVMRIFFGDFVAGEIDGQPISQKMWLGVSAFMLLPILMVFFSLVLDRSINRWANIIVAGVFFAFNGLSLHTYPSAYDRFLLAVSLVFNGLTIWYAWTWT